MTVSPRLAAPSAPRALASSRAHLSARTWMLTAVALTLVDAAATSAWLLTRQAAELNPLLDSLAVAIGVVPAMAVRAGVGIGLVLALHGLRHRSRLAAWGVVAVTVVLALVVAWHGVGLALLLGVV